MSESLSDPTRTSQDPTGQLSAPSGQFPDPIPGVIPFGSFNLLSGAPKVGKTSLYTSWIARWLAGKTICGRATNCPTEIGILTTDHKWELNQGIWCRRNGILDIRHYSLRDDPKLDWSQLRNSWNSRRTLLEKSLDRLGLPPGGMVMIDVAPIFITNKLNDYNEVAAGIGTITQLFDERQLTTLGIGHMSKQRSDPKERYLRAHERMTGSGAQIGFSDTPMSLLSPEDTGEPYHLFEWTPTDGSRGQFKFKQNQETGLFEMWSELDEHIVSTDPLAQIIRDFPDPPAILDYGDIIEQIKAACQIELTAAKERFNELIADGRIVRIRHGKYGKRNPS